MGELFSLDYRGHIDIFNKIVHAVAFRALLANPEKQQLRLAMEPKLASFERNSAAWPPEKIQPFNSPLFDDLEVPQGKELVPETEKILSLVYNFFEVVQQRFQWLPINDV